MQGLEDRFAPPVRFAAAVDELHDVAAKVGGGDDFGGDDYHAGLSVLLQSMDYDPRFSPRGRAIAWGSLVSALAARAHAVAAMRQVPGFDRVPIAQPVVITGIPRTGTTALHKLLGVDWRFQGLHGWLMATPMPRPPRVDWDADPRFRDAVERLELRFAATPGRRAAHDMAADQYDECGGLLRQGFVSNLWTCGWSSASYDLWWQTQSELASYRWLRRLYQLIGAHEPGRRWLLKNPGHIDNLDALFAVFPDAQVIQTHRDPAAAIPSLCSLLIKNHPVMEEGRLDQRARLMGIRETEKWARALRRAEPVRAARADQVLDVRHADFHRDPMGAIASIYRFIGMELTDNVARAMRARIADDPEAAHGIHRYDIADFGISEGHVRERFGDYVARFDLVHAREEAA